MKKTVTVNLSGIVFHIDEDAYELLSNYLNLINARFSDENEAKEIMADIESRIAEIFSEKLQGRQVIEIQDIEEIMATIGKPEDFESSGYKEENEAFSEAQKGYKRMYRDPDERILGGVCGGIAAYFNTDPVVIRALFVIVLIISAGTAFIAYLVLWFIIPEAQTRAQKLEMRGKHVNLENIEKTVRQEFNTVKENIKKIDFSKKLRDLGLSLEKLLLKLGKGILAAFKSLWIFIGILLLLTGLFLLLMLTGSFWSNKLYISASSFFSSSYSLPNLLATITSAPVATFTSIGIILVAGIPMVWLIYSGIRLVFRIRSHDRIFNILTSFLFVSGLAILFISAVIIGKDFRAESRTTLKEIIPQATNDTLYLGFLPDSSENGFYLLKSNDFKIFTSKVRPQLMISPTYRIKGSFNYFVSVEKNITARGNNTLDAKQNIENLSFTIIANKDSIRFSPYFTIEKHKKYRGQWIENTLFIPVGKYVFLDESFKNLITDFEGDRSIYPEKFFNRYLKMTSKGLVLAE